MLLGVYLYSDTSQSANFVYKVTEKQFSQQIEKNVDDSTPNVDCILQNHFPHSLL